ncbi:MAG TPA: SurA, partial [Beutenbergiaceae bacterium]|nr:SurA [Beutenbergiaceae bacterium]
MPIRRSLAVLFLAGLTALAACSSDGSDAPEENPAGDADTDQLEEQLQAPEPDIDDVPDVVAEVNGEEIDREEFITAYEGQLQQAFMMQQGEDVDQAE